jgi:hypothetical protein
LREKQKSLKLDRMSNDFRSPLLMDTDENYLGNSPGVDGRGRLHTKISNRQTEPVPVVIIPGAINQVIHIANADNTTPGSYQTLITSIVPSNTIRYLYKAQINVRQEGVFQVLANGDLIGSGRTGPGLSPVFEWMPQKPLTAGTVVELKFMQRPNSPSVTCEGYLMGIDQSQGA